MGQLSGGGGNGGGNRRAFRVRRDSGWATWIEEKLTPTAQLQGTVVMRRPLFYSGHCQEHFCCIRCTRLDPWSTGNERSRQRATVDLHGKAAKTATHTDVP